MRISVVIPVYNEELYIVRCLEAIARQTVAPDEVIVVDNNSVDKTADLVNKFSFVKLIGETKQGMIPARDAGIRVASGDIIARCDADTIAYPDWIENIRQSFTSHGVIDGVSGPADYYDIRFKKLCNFLQKKIYFDTWRFFKHTELLFGSNMAFRKSMWEKVYTKLAKSDDEMHEDMDMSIQISKAGGKIIYDPSVRVTISARRYTKSWTSLPSYLGRFIKAFFV
jgi:glycosyltransferase involved in cell wall biosynthesis